MTKLYFLSECVDFSLIMMQLIFHPNIWINWSRNIKCIWIQEKSKHSEKKYAFVTTLLIYIYKMVLRKLLPNITNRKIKLLKLIQYDIASI